MQCLECGDALVKSYSGARCNVSSVVMHWSNHIRELDAMSRVW